MHCPFCGEDNPSVAQFCGGCGRPLPVGRAGESVMPPTPMPMPTPARDPATYPNVQPVPSPEPYPPYVPGSEKPSPVELLGLARRQHLGMRWYKFLIYFQLFVSSIAMLTRGVLQSTGFLYVLAAMIKGTTVVGVDVSNARYALDLMYEMYPTLRVVDIACGCTFMVAGVLAIVVRMLLARFKPLGITLLYLMIVLDVAAGIAFNVYGLIELGVHDASDFFGFILPCFNLILLGFNVVYFKQRRHLFVR